jgi:8-oxo-dGTP diphosphatase
MDQNKVISYYSDRPKILVAVDCIIFGFDEGELKLLLMKKQMGSKIGEWSLIGSFIDPAEDLNDGAKRVLKECTGLSDVYLEQSYSYGIVDRVPGDRVISIGYYALIRIDDHDKETVKEFGAEWFKFNSRPALIFDHDKMVSDAVNKLKRKTRNQSLGFELLPEKFTIPQLRQFFEEIYQISIDKRNFRKKILYMDILKKLEEKDKANSKKGAFLYSFDREKYESNPDLKALF